MEPKTQGAVLLQSLLRLPSPSNQPVLDRYVYSSHHKDLRQTKYRYSIQSLSVDDLLAMAFHVTSSRVLDAIFDSPTVPPKSKRAFVLRFIGHFHILYDDRIGSRVGDRCWAFADPYFRVRPPSIVPFLVSLTPSYSFEYGLNCCFRRKLHDQWYHTRTHSQDPRTANISPEISTCDS